MDGVSASVVTLLGPTNTGKTHRAIERMLTFPSGMIGLPLRLLAREVYDRVSSQIGEQQVALVTGEEKRIPHRPAYWVCTVEAMPLNRDVDFLAVDEIQLAAHSERGHAFTDRILNARGRKETWFLGSDTVKRLLAEVLPTAEQLTAPRLSKLTHAGRSKLGSLPPRSAVVAFSIRRVYEIAERLRKLRGGAAVVLGALSPRARNAQVALYQSGEVSYLVATDAIGMGLNLDIDHVAFADVRKFDGRRPRALDISEVAQIAGRAGRYTRDGTFGTVNPLPELADDVVHRVETHRFEPVRQLVWRNSDLDMSSIDALVQSLRREPPFRRLRRVETADDYRALVTLAERGAIRNRARHAQDVELLWSVCQIPDYRKQWLDEHANLVGEIFIQLRDHLQLQPAWLNQHIKRLDDPVGDIDTLLKRISYIRTWTYVTHRGDWVTDAAGWQERARAVEDRLSDALHEQLVQRFVERSMARGSSRRRRPIATPASESHPFAKLAVLAEQMQADLDWEDDETDVWEDIVEAPHDEMVVDVTGLVRAMGRPVGRLLPGSSLLQPEVALDKSLDELDGSMRLRLTRRLAAFGRDFVNDVLGPLRDPVLRERSAAARGLLYSLERGMGAVRASEVEMLIYGLDEPDRQALIAAGICVGKLFVYAQDRFGQSVLHDRQLLCRTYLRDRDRERWPRPSNPLGNVGRLDAELLFAAGYATFGDRCYRVDWLEETLATVSNPKTLSKRLEAPREVVSTLLSALGRTTEQPRRRRRRPRKRA